MSARPRALRAVLFDYGHTLIHFDERPHSLLLTAYEKVNRLLASTLSREVPAADVLIDRISRVVDDEIQRDYALGREEEVEIASLYDQALRALGLELDPALIEQVMEIEQDGWLNSVHKGPDVVATLERLRAAGLRLGVVSNAAYRPQLMVRQMEALGLAKYFGALTFSSAVGVRKPHPAIYQDALSRLGVRADESLFIGDRVREDVRGPKSLGMRTILLREWRKEEDPGAADYVIDRLGEVPAIVDRLKQGSSAAGTYNG
ncbi:MAG: HAD family hydrolase [Candidatus Dormibacteraeota bacterium]|nr:HAD family hydrolase [Candidatus Dormibacteraeota bacterium]